MSRRSPTWPGRTSRSCGLACAGEIQESFTLAALARATATGRPAGKARMEGKDYVMQDGDVVEFRFNV
jgi:ribosome-binding ATPase YchF (GTP1/OBG family)